MVSLPLRDYPLPDDAPARAVLRPQADVPLKNGGKRERVHQCGGTAQAAEEAGRDLDLDITIIREPAAGKFNALNTALRTIQTDYLVTLDADTLLHRDAVKNLMARMRSAPAQVVAVAGAVLTRNSRANLIARVQEWDYFLGIASIKRMQGLYQGTLVAQGAYSLYKTAAVRTAGGWPDAIGEDIVLTWNMLKNGGLVYFEPLAVAFTDVPETLRHLQKQRSRWARGMIEALKEIKPWQHSLRFVKYMTGINLVMPYLDTAYTLLWLPGMVLAAFGVYWIVGPMTLLVLPLALIQNYVLYRYQNRVFDTLGLKIRRNRMGFVLYVFVYQMLMSPMSLIGYVQEMLSSTRTWK